MDLIQLMKTRRSVRAYLPQPVAPEQLQHILTAADWWMWVKRFTRLPV